MGSRLLRLARRGLDARSARLFGHPPVRAIVDEVREELVDPPSVIAVRAFSDEAIELERRIVECPFEVETCVE